MNQIENGVSTTSGSEAGLLMLSGFEPIATVSTPRGARVLIFPEEARGVLARFSEFRAKADKMLGRA